MANLYLNMEIIAVCREKESNDLLATSQKRRNEKT
jgi:hypothetical protein